MSAAKAGPEGGARHRSTFPIQDDAPIATTATEPYIAGDSCPLRDGREVTRLGRRGLAGKPRLGRAGRGKAWRGRLFRRVRSGPAGSTLIPPQPAAGRTAGALADAGIPDSAHPAACPPRSQEPHTAATAAEPHPLPRRPSADQAAPAGPAARSCRLCRSKSCSAQPATEYGRPAEPGHERGPRHRPGRPQHFQNVTA